MQDKYQVGSSNGKIENSNQRGVPNGEAWANVSHLTFGGWNQFKLSIK
jgi:hypothetical protein